jgi:hypothetical protein
LSPDETVDRGLGGYYLQLVHGTARPFWGVIVYDWVGGPVNGDFGANSGVRDFEDRATDDAEIEVIVAHFRDLVSRIKTGAMPVADFVIFPPVTACRC